MPFQKGQSGNPSGRPPGIQDKRAALRDLLDPHADELVKQAVKMALEGDTAALKLCLDRLIPPMKTAPVNIPGLAVGSLAERGAAVLDALGGGEIEPAQGAVLLSALQSQARIVEVSEIIERLEVLENERHN
ncbi:DUF5681 domain-containing protein [Candidatus Venteria ishoeyi]|uniref:DUF5681 domain-containing protein n=1 Tax=Candidatus Venteria ishoeyi TaxID=1899563 RepID=A0A1H6FBI3_9GAMM|nr:DUF5681 domain-containing protein [Candidatus Venteria ishoeyi]MDM8545171.1 DUF5681 domain-containing protein [Candidatus Venteria ishoeyi]SEH06689.1 Uncharacterised protein [Candidatus Venteria ishoeyi]